MNDYINHRLQSHYADTSFILTIILQFFCYRYIKYSELILIFSTLMFFTNFLIIVESIDCVLKNINVIKNIRNGFFAVNSIIFFICICLILFCNVENEFLVLIILPITFVIFLVNFM